MAVNQPFSDSKTVAQRAIEALGKGYDVVADLRLSFCKGDLESRLIVLDETQVQELVFPGGIKIPNVPRAIKCDKGERTRFSSDVLSFHQMSEQFNQGLAISGKIPLGLFNAMFRLTGSWQSDASSTKSLAMDGWFITLYSVELPRSQVVLREEVKRAVPRSWDPAALARFINRYGTHIIVGMKIGGKDVLYLKQHQSSVRTPLEIQKILKKKAEERFTGVETNTSLDSRGIADKERTVDQPAWMDRTNQLVFGINCSVVDMKDMTILCQRRGGHDSKPNLSHCQWLHTVPSAPTVISMNFVPITSLLNGVPGSGFLNNAVNLYLRYKPPIDELYHFLEFQLSRLWAPVFNELPLGPPRKEHGPPALQFGLMRPKLYVKTSPVLVGKKPVTGLRLYLEGKKSNWLAIHLQHLATPPQILRPLWENGGELKWQGPEQFDPRYFEPVLWKSFSHVCTAPVANSKNIESCEDWHDAPAEAHIVVGAQLGVMEFSAKNILHLKLLYSRIPNVRIRRSEWDHSPATSQKSGIFSTLMSTTFSSTQTLPKPAPVIMNSGIFQGVPPVPVRVPKMLKFVDTTEMTKGPHDIPGYWLVTGAKLCLDRGKISLHVKYSLLSY
eukprot:c26515_g1_i1 orf=500-2338(-)